MTKAEQLLNALYECSVGETYTVEMDGAPVKVKIKEVADGEAVVAKLDAEGKEVGGDDELMSISIKDLESKDSKNESKTCSVKKGGASKAKFKKYKPKHHLVKS